MRGFRRRGIRPGRRKNPLIGIVWMIGLAVLFYTDHWWPGILILVGISMALSAVSKETGTETLPEPEWERPAAPPPTPVITPPPTPVINPPPAPAPSSAPRVDLLLGKTTCPRCGAPIRSNEVKWTSTHSAICSYCGSTILDAKNKSG